MNFCIEVVEMHNKSRQIEHMNKLLMSIILQLINWSIMYLYFTATSQYDMNDMEVTNVKVHRTPGNKSYIVFCSIILCFQYWNLFSFTYKNQEEFLFFILSSLTLDLPSPVPWVPLYLLGGSSQSAKLTMHLYLLLSSWMTVSLPLCLMYTFTVWYLVIGEIW